MSFRWYANRLRRMSPAELAWRARDQLLMTGWTLASRHAAMDGPVTSASLHRVPPMPLPESARANVPEAAAAAVAAAADGLLAGRWQVLGAPRPDITQPDWFLDPTSGRRAPSTEPAFRINPRDERVTGNVKQVWELSRLHHLTLLAAAFSLTGKDDYVETIAGGLGSWFSLNPVLMGINWTSGIELGVRLISLAWIRRLIGDWPHAAAIFENDPAAVRQIYWHQRYLASFPSRRSSANNHLIAEAAGRLVAACAFPWYEESDEWRASASTQLERALRQNTFASGINREQATEYHRFVAELAAVAAAEADAVGHPLSGETHALLCEIFDAAAAIPDRTGRPPRQGDGDEGRALVLDDPDADTWQIVMGIGSGIYGRREWWPPTPVPSVAACFVPGVARRRRVPGRPGTRPDHFPDAGLTILRTGRSDEIWCRCDGGPHGFGSIAAHAHADALSVELRVDGVDVFADPGTYCYHGDPVWRSYFRSTLGHNTLEIDGADQSVSGGPFLWSRQAASLLLEVDVTPGARTVVWMAEHGGYRRLGNPVTHRRRVELDRLARVLTIVDEVHSDAAHDVRMAYHLGPLVSARLHGNVATLQWSDSDRPRCARLMLPDSLTWSAVRGCVDPPMGWYSEGLGRRSATTTLVGSGRPAPSHALISVLTLPRHDSYPCPNSP